MTAVPMTAVRDAAAADADVLVAFNRAMALETESRDLSAATLARGVRGVFEDPARGFYLIAERDGAAVGCLLVTREWSDWRDGDLWWIQSVYVVPEARRQGVFRRLHEEVRRRAGAAAGVVGLRLYVEKDNRRAQQVYARLGMTAPGYVVMEETFAPP